MNILINTIKIHIIDYAIQNVAKHWINQLNQNLTHIVIKYTTINGSPAYYVFFKNILSIKVICITYRDIQQYYEYNKINDNKFFLHSSEDEMKIDNKTIAYKTSTDTDWKFIYDTVTKHFMYQELNK
jgi:hypothetical protein